MVRFSIMKWRRRFSCLKKQKEHHHSNQLQRHYRIMSLQSGKLLSLTRNDVKQLKKSWRKLTDRQKWAQSLFLKMCEQKTFFKKAFGYESVELAQIETSEKFKLHSRHFVEFWNDIIENLRLEHDFSVHHSLQHQKDDDDDDDDFYQDHNQSDNKDIVVSRIRCLGRQHADNRLIRFDADTWLFFKRCIIDSFCDNQEADLRNKTCLAWSKLLHFVVAEMMNAFHEGVRTRNNCDRLSDGVREEPYSNDTVESTNPRTTL